MKQGKAVDLTVAPQDHGLALQIKEEVEVALTKLRQGNAEMAAALLKRTQQKTPPRFPAHDIVVQNLLTAYKMRIEQLLKEKAAAAVINPYLQEAQALELRGRMAQEQEFRRRFADTFHALGLALSRRRHYEAALAFYRKALAIQSCPTYYVNLTNALGFTKQRAQLSDFTADYTPEQLGRHLFIACAPKSGSTFLKNVLVGLTGYKELFAVYAALQNEHEIDRPILARYGDCDSVTQQHCRASEANIHLMQAFQIRPVILVRNIFDSVVSLLDFYQRGYTVSTYFAREDFARMTAEQRIDLLIDNVIPWYFQFIASWQRAAAERRVELHWLTYEELIADKPAALARVLKFYQLEAARAEIQAVIAEVESNAGANRFNKGVAGRGRVLLAPPQKERIAALSRHFPNNDFSLVGL